MIRVKADMHEPIELDGLSASSSSTADAGPDSVAPVAAEGVRWTWRVVLINLSLFIAAGLCEIVGGWLYWRYFRSDDDARRWWQLMMGMILLLLYGWIPTLQPAAMQFGRTYAVYGGIFIFLSLGWGWIADGNQPDKGDFIGAAIAVAGVLVMLYWPRESQ